MAPNITTGGFWNIDLLRNLSKRFPSKGDNCASSTVKFRASLNHGLDVYITMEAFVYVLWWGRRPNAASVPILLERVSITYTSWRVTTDWFSYSHHRAFVSLSPLRVRMAHLTNA
jgi:hypothetical protein